MKTFSNPSTLSSSWFNSMFKPEEFNHIDKVMHRKSFLFAFKTPLQAEVEFFLMYRNTWISRSSSILSCLPKCKIQNLSFHWQHVSKASDDRIWGFNWGKNSNMEGICHTFHLYWVVISQTDKIIIIFTNTKIKTQVQKQSSSIPWDIPEFQTLLHSPERHFSENKEL